MWCLLRFFPQTLTLIIISLYSKALIFVYVNKLLGKAETKNPDRAEISSNPLYLTKPIKTKYNK